MVKLLFATEGLLTSSQKKPQKLLRLATSPTILRTNVENLLMPYQVRNVLVQASSTFALAPIPVITNLCYCCAPLRLLCSRFAILVSISVRLVKKLFTTRGTSQCAFPKASQQTPNSPGEEDSWTILSMTERTNLEFRSPAPENLFSPDDRYRDTSCRSLLVLLNVVPRPIIVCKRGILKMECLCTYMNLCIPAPIAILHCFISAYNR